MRLYLFSPMKKKVYAAILLVTVAMFSLVGELQEGAYGIAIAFTALVIAFVLLLGNFVRISGEEE